MKNIFITLVYFLTIQVSNAVEVEYLHLKSGDIIDAKNSSYNISKDEVKAIEISTESNDTKLISPVQYERLLQGKLPLLDDSRSSKLGGEGGNG